VEREERSTTSHAIQERITDVQNMSFLLSINEMGKMRWERSDAGWKAYATTGFEWDRPCAWLKNREMVLVLPVVRADQ
jgi:hypothetical protein